MRPLLSRLSPSISLSLSSCLYHILDGDTSSILAFLPKSEHNQEELIKRQEEYLSRLFQLLQRNSFDSYSQLATFLNDIDLDETYARAIYGFNALLNKQVDDIPKIFKLVDDNIDAFTMEFIKSLTNFTIKNDKKELPYLITSIAHQSASEEINRMSVEITQNHSWPQYKFIKKMVEAMNGDIYSFGEF